LRLTPLVFIIKACILALKEFPRFNASLDEAGENLVFKKYFNIGFAADTPNGLVVPVIANADRLDIYETARTLASMSEKARAGKLKAAEMHGGSFTISSLGGIGRHVFYAHHQCPGGRRPGGVQNDSETGVRAWRIRPAPDAAFVAVI